MMATQSMESLDLEHLSGHEGYVPPRYKRGKLTADALLEAGRQRLRTHSLDEMTIEEICANASVTTGAFYRRFLSKTAYFKALQAFAIEDSKEGYANLLTQLDEQRGDLREAIALVVCSIRLWYCKHEGVIRASQMQRSHDVLSWEPIKQIGFQHVKQVAQRLEALCEQPVSPELSKRISFSFQVVFGTLVNAVINDPGPLALSDKALDEELTMVVFAYLHSAIKTSEKP